MNKLKVLSLGLTLIGLVINVVQAVISNKQMEATIYEEVVKVYTNATEI